MLFARRMLMMEDDEEMKEWKLINDITIYEETNILEINKDIDSNNFECDEMIFFLKNVGTSNNTNANKNATFYLSGINIGYLANISLADDLTRTYIGKINAKPLYWNMWCINSNLDTTGGNTINTLNGGYSFVDPIEKINSIKMQPQATYFGAGTRLKVYGR